MITREIIEQAAQRDSYMEQDIRVYKLYCNCHVYLKIEYEKYHLFNKHSVCVRHCSKYSKNINPFNPPNNCNEIDILFHMIEEVS